MAIARATRGLSPESITVRRMPSRARCAIVSLASGRSVSATPRTPRKRPGAADDHGRLPGLLERVDRRDDRRRQLALEQAAVADPRPCRRRSVRAGPCRAPRSPSSPPRGGVIRAPAPPPGSAMASGWLDSASSPAAVARTSSSLAPSMARVAIRRGFPWVSVPVLSNAIARTLPSASRCAPPLIKTPPFAARATAAKTAEGVEIASAHGEAATMSDTPRRIAACQRRCRWRSDHWQRGRDHEHDRNERSLEPLREALGGALLRLGLGDHIDDAREQRLAREAW